jgi:hypothetical protein
MSAAETVQSGVIGSARLAAAGVVGLERGSPLGLEELLADESLVEQKGLLSPSFSLGEKASQATLFAHGKRRLDFLARSMSTLLKARRSVFDTTECSADTFRHWRGVSALDRLQPRVLLRMVRGFTARSDRA